MAFSSCTNLPVGFACLILHSHGINIDNPCLSCIDLQSIAVACPHLNCYPLKNSDRMVSVLCTGEQFRGRKEPHEQSRTNLFIYSYSCQFH